MGCSGWDLGGLCDTQRDSVPHHLEGATWKWVGGMCDQDEASGVLRSSPEARVARAGAGRTPDRQPHISAAHAIGWLATHLREYVPGDISHFRYRIMTTVGLHPRHRSITSDQGA